MSEDPHAQNPNSDAGDPSETPPSHETGKEEAFQGSTGRSLSETLRQLPDQYLKVLTKPGAQTFVAQVGKASWDIVVMQMMICASVIAVFGYLELFLGANGPLPSGFVNGGILRDGFGIGDVVTLFIFSSMTLVIIGLTFFLNTGMTYVAAKALGGKGTFLSHSYVSALWMMPLMMLNVALSSLPVIGLLVSSSGWAFTLYGIVLNIFGTMAAHRLSGRRATMAVLLPVIVLLGLGSLLMFGLYVGSAPTPAVPIMAPEPVLAPALAPAHHMGGCSR